MLTMIRRWLLLRELRRRVRQLDVSLSIAEADFAMLVARRRGR